MRDCTVSCASANDCTGGQVCSTDGWCAAPETSCVGIASDASTSGADALCAAGCDKGTCVAGVCVIDCSAADTCPNDVTCPANIPCRVRCGDRSCDKKVLCGAASFCEVQCSGVDSCGDDIMCGERPCDVECTGSGSCKQIKCGQSCACDVTCSPGACETAAECPREEDACTLGRGCSSEIAGCDRCAD